MREVEAGTERRVVGGQRIARADLAVVFEDHFVPKNCDTR